MNDTTTFDLATPAVLHRAANTIDRVGLAKEDYVDDHGGHCSAAAIADACGFLYPSDCYVGPLLPESRAAHTALRALVGHIYPDSRPETLSHRELVEKIAAWNDDDQRTADQVTEAMRAAAREAVTERA